MTGGKGFWSLAVVLAVAATPAEALVLCASKRGALKVREACKPKEQAVDPAALGLVGPQGPAGPAGVQGEPGPAGPTGPTGVAQVVARTGSFTFPQNNGSTGQYLDGDVQCQPGETVVGGGHDLSNSVSSGGQPNVIVLLSRPALANGAAPGNGDTPTGWFVEARRNVDTVATTVTFYVLCASP